MRTEISLVGGLGNQLFIVAYALFSKNVTLHDVTLRVVREGRGNETHGGLVLKDLDEDVDIPWFIEGRIGHWLSKARRVLAVKFNSWNFGPDGVTYTHDGKAIGTAPCRRLTKFDNIETGYFQDPKFLEEIRKLGFLNDLAPRNPSGWFLNIAESNDWDQALAVHVRLGDFTGKSGPGALSIEYYKEAIALSLEECEDKRVVVFSDAILEVEGLFLESLPQYRFIFVKPPQQASALESLSLMSRFHSIVISNSTFGWWAAVSGESRKNVFAPKTWSRQSVEESHLNFESWVTLTSSWTPQA